MIDYQHHRYLRTAETRDVLPLFGEPPASVLEIGAGAGWQASILSASGFHVTAIDVPQPQYQRDKAYPVLPYDGKTLPFPNRSFDIVFSSNVLEHIPHVEEFQAEIHRVLKPGGRAIHMMPTSAWLISSIAMHYPWVLKEACRAFFRRSLPATDMASNGRHWTFAQLALYALFPRRHGERGNVVTEIALFQKKAWIDLFDRTGWQVVDCRPNQLYYSGHTILGYSAGIPLRRALSYCLGSGSRTYVLRPRQRP